MGSHSRADGTFARSGLGDGFYGGVASRSPALIGWVWGLGEEEKSRGTGIIHQVVPCRLALFLAVGIVLLAPCCRPAARSSPLAVGASFRRPRALASGRLKFPSCCVPALSIKKEYNPSLGASLLSGAGGRLCARGARSASLRPLVPLRCVGSGFLPPPFWLFSVAALGCRPRLHPPTLASV